MSFRLEFQADRDAHWWNCKLIAVLYFWALDAWISLFEAKLNIDCMMKYESYQLVYSAIHSYWIWNVFHLTIYIESVVRKTSLFCFGKIILADTSGSATSGNMFIIPAVPVLGVQDTMTAKWQAHTFVYTHTHTHTRFTTPYLDYDTALLDVL